MNFPEPDGKDSFDYFSTNLGYRVTVLIYPPTDELIERAFHFLDLNQRFPLLPFIEQAALKRANGDANKARDLIRLALAWLEGKSQTSKKKYAGAEVLDAAFHERAQVFKNWQRQTLIPLIDKGELTKDIGQAISTALSNFDRIQCEELAAKVGYKLNTSLLTPEGIYKTKKVRGRRVPVFKANLGRAKGSKNAKPKVTYERIVREVELFRGNIYGHIPTRKQIAKKIGCHETTIKNCLLESGEVRRFSVFARALIGEE